MNAPKLVLPSPPPPGAARSANRRRWLLYSAVAGAAAATGLGLAWRNGRFDLKPASSRLALWSLSFQAPDQTSLAMQSFAGKPLLLNFWATWCQPCVEELPLLDRFFQQNSINGWQVLGLAVDQLAAVEIFLRRTPVKFPVALAGMAGIELSKSLGNSTGGLPFTVVLGSSGSVEQRKMGRVNEADLLLWSALI